MASRIHDRRKNLLHLRLGRARGQEDIAICALELEYRWSPLIALRSVEQAAFVPKSCLLIVPEAAGEIGLIGGCFIHRSSESPEWPVHMW
jgi:hypothetical protein